MNQQNRGKSTGFDPGRRAALAKLGRFAAYTAPTLTTLLIARDAGAHHRPGHIAGPVDLCDRPNPPPACDQLPTNPCENAPNNPLCQAVGSTGGGDPSSARFSGEDYDFPPQPAYDDGWYDSGFTDE